jgi:hypothetical protein
VLFAIIGCADKKPTALATLIAHEGVVHKRIGHSSWQDASIGDVFQDGDAIQTGTDGNARLRLRNSQELSLESDTILEFGRGALKVAGELRAEQDLVLDLVFGTAYVASGSRLKVDKDESGHDRFQLLFGTASVQRDGRTVQIASGETARFDGATGEPLVAAKSLTLETVPTMDAGPTEEKEEPPPTLSVELDSGRATLREGATSLGELTRGTHTLKPGTEVSLAKRGSVSIRRGTDSVIVTGPAAFAIGTVEGPFIALRAGSALAHGKSGAVEVSVPGGKVIAKPRGRAGATARISVNRRGVQVTAGVGQVDVVGIQGGTASIEIGERVELSAAGKVTVRDRAPTWDHLTVNAGESAYIHDPLAPTNVRVSFVPYCEAEGGVLELSKNRSFQNTRLVKGERGAVARLEPGTYHYRIRCIALGDVTNRSVAEGTLRLTRTAGTKKLPPRPARNEVEANGLNYRIVFQNLVPDIVFRWSGAPPEGAYALHIKAPGLKKTIPARTNKIMLPSGALKEGRYDFWFARDGGASSATTSLQILFNNAAQRAYLKSPSLHEAWSTSVHLEGAAIRGWSASVGQTSLDLDDQHRFRADIAVPANQAAIAIRFSRPRHDSHYFVRRPHNQRIAVLGTR